MAIASALMENSGTGAQNVAVQRDVSTGDRRANARSAEGRDFVLTANSDIGVPIASVKMMMMLYMQQVKAAGFGSGLGFRDLR